MCSAWSDFQILLLFVAFWLILGVGELVLAFILFYFFQVLPALPSCAGCVSENVWVGRAYMQSLSCTCLSHLRTFFYTDKFVTIFTLEKKEEQMVVYSKILYQRKKKNQRHHLLYTLGTKHCCWMCKSKPMENTFSQTLNGVMDSVPPQFVTKPTYCRLRNSTWTAHLKCVCRCRHPSSHRHMQRFPLHLVLSNDYVLFCFLFVFPVISV